MFISFLSSTPLTFNSFAVHACTYSWADLASSSVKIGSSPTGFTRPESSFRVKTRGTRSVQVWNGYVVSSIDLFFMALFTGVNIEVGWISDCKSSSFMLDGLNVDQEIKTVWKLYITPHDVPTVYAFSSQMVKTLPPVVLGWWMEMYCPVTLHLMCLTLEMKSADFKLSPHTASELKLDQKWLLPLSRTVTNWINRANDLFAVSFCHITQNSII